VNRPKSRKFLEFRQIVLLLTVVWTRRCSPSANTVPRGRPMKLPVAPWSGRSTESSQQLSFSLW